MSAVGGSIESVEIDGRVFAVASDADATKKLGGFENEMMANGDGTAREVKTRVPWSVDGLSLSVDDDRGDHEYLQERANSTELSTMVLTLASGVVYQGRGKITGELGGSTNNATASVTLSGPGTLSKQ